jgi:hypothetical protein
MIVKHILLSMIGLGILAGCQQKPKMVEEEQKEVQEMQEAPGETPVAAEPTTTTEAGQ